MDELARRLAALEGRVSHSTGVNSDMRVIEMQIARAEEKILRLGRSASWTRPGLPIMMTEEQ